MLVDQVVGEIEMEHFAGAEDLSVLDLCAAAAIFERAFRRALQRTAAHRLLARAGLALGLEVMKGYRAKRCGGGDA